MRKTTKRRTQRQPISLKICTMFKKSVRAWPLSRSCRTWSIQRLDWDPPRMHTGYPEGSGKTSACWSKVSSTLIVASKVSFANLLRLALASAPDGVCRADEVSQGPPKRNRARAALTRPAYSTSQHNVVLHDETSASYTGTTGNAGTGARQPRLASVYPASCSLAVRQ